MKVTHPGDKKWLKALIYGPAGHGKTTFVATAQLDSRTSPMLFIDFEGGEQSLSGLDIDMVTIRTWPDYDEVYTELASGRTEYKSIALDSISETHIFSLLDILEKEGPNRKDPNALQQQDYGKSTILMRRLLRAFRDLPMHVFFTCAAKEENEVRVGTVKKPALAGQMSEELSGMMDVVAYLALAKNEEDEDIRALLLKNDSHYRIKIRSGWGQELPDLIEESEPRQFATQGVTLLLDALNFPEEDGEEASTPKRRKKK